jgi:hypothetical protein
MLAQASRWIAGRSHPEVAGQGMYDSSTADAAEVTLKHFLITHQWFVPHATINNAGFPVPDFRDIWDVGRFLQDSRSGLQGCP